MKTITQERLAESGAVYREPVSRYRGHAGYIQKVHGQDDTWVEIDPLPGPKTSTVRKCGFCHLPNRADECDPCIGRLPGVMNACCGHGDGRTAYVQFPSDSRPILRGRSAITYLCARTGISTDQLEAYFHDFAEFATPLKLVCERLEYVLGSRLIRKLFPENFVYRSCADLDPTGPYDPWETATIEHIEVLRRITEGLLGSYSALGVRGWFDRPRIQLQGKSPIQLFTPRWVPSLDGVQEVVTLARSLRA